MSVHALTGQKHLTHRHQSEGVPDHRGVLDPATLIARATLNRAISDRAFRVFTLVAAAYPHTEVDAATIANHMGLTEGQAGHLLGDLVSADVLTSRRRKVGYHADGRRIRRTVYRLAGGESA